MCFSNVPNAAPVSLEDTVLVITLVMITDKTAPPQIKGNITIQNMIISFTKICNERKRHILQVNMSYKNIFPC